EWIFAGCLAKGERHQRGQASGSGGAAGDDGGGGETYRAHSHLAIRVPRSRFETRERTNHTNHTRFGTGSAHLHEGRGFVGARSPAGRHGNVEDAQVHAELAAMLIPVA